MNKLGLITQRILKRWGKYMQYRRGMYIAGIMIEVLKTTTEDERDMLMFAVPYDEIIKHATMRKLMKVVEKEKEHIHDWDLKIKKTKIDKVPLPIIDYYLVCKCGTSEMIMEVIE